MTMPVHLEKISVIGLGAMGSSLATFLLKAGYEVKGFDILEKRMSDLEPYGLVSVKCPREAAEGADLMILSLAYWSVVKEVVEGKDGILEGARKGQIIIDTSTVPPLETKAMAERLQKKGIVWMDVPISGSAAQLKVGDVVFFAGGEKSAFDLVKPILDKIGKRTVYVGKNGDAAMLKLVVNHILFLNMASAAEGLVVALKAGLDPTVTLDVLVSGAAGSGLLAARGKNMLDGNFEPKGMLRMTIKDVELIMENAKQMGVMVPMLALYEQFMFKGVHRGWSELDGTVTMRLWKEMAGVER
jgi:3-hydroxyisobutyrate dehydrogenase-like beta-hydroxyacid dehydrogenase